MHRRNGGSVRNEDFAREIVRKLEVSRQTLAARALHHTSIIAITHTQVIACAFISAVDAEAMLLRNGVAERL